MTTMMKFWRLNHPAYGNDYAHSFINGSLEHLYGMPGVRCDACRETWARTQVLTAECPPALRGHRQILDGWPVSLEQHEALQGDVRKHFLAADVAVSSLAPGVRFQPCYLDVPSRPRADFLWASIGSVVVSARVRDLFLEHCVTGASCIPVIMRKVGSREARLPPPIPETSEPEDIIREVPPFDSNESLPQYFELVVEAESAFAPDAEPTLACSVCGRETFPATPSRLSMRASMWQGADVFFLAGTLHVFVTDRVQQALRRLKATNVHYELA